MNKGVSIVHLLYAHKVIRLKGINIIKANEGTYLRTHLDTKLSWKIHMLHIKKSKQA